MEIQLKIAQDVTGRWSWSLLANDDRHVYGQITTSAVSFESREAADSDFVMHCAAHEDETGRKIRSKEEILNLLKAAVAMCDDCKELALSPVRWHKPDENGRNWELRYVAGHETRGCLVHLYVIERVLGARYNIPNEG